MRTTKAVAVNPAPPAAEWENVGSHEPSTNENSHTAPKAVPTLKAIMASPDHGWRSLAKGQLPKVKPVKMNDRIVQNSTAPMAADEASNTCQRGEASSHHSNEATIHTPAVTTTGVAAPKRGTMVTAGSGDGAAGAGAGGAGTVVGAAASAAASISACTSW